ncbi:MAG: hypothetical protein H8E66_28620 [Planctomycetes bacterium]|nr:hypothetical protein [Planctomycetota bacterium]
MRRIVTVGLMMIAAVMAGKSSVFAGDLSTYFHHDGILRGTLKSDTPLPIYDADPQHLWNGLFAAFYIRPRALPATEEQPETVRYEGGDVIEFLAWGKTTYWSSEAVSRKVNPLLDEFLKADGSKLIKEPLKRAVFQHDLWAVYDHLIDLNIRRISDLQTRLRRDTLCGKIARCIEQLKLTQREFEQLPDTYPLAINSGEFVSDHNFDSAVDYLPRGLLTEPDEWVEIDFYYPKMHEDIMDRFISLHARSLQGRSHYRIFYRFPEGRQQVVDYLKEIEEKAIDWKRAAQFGFIPPPTTAPQIPVGTEVVLLQLMMSMDEQLRPVPTRIVESFQFRVFRNLDGSSEPTTNTGVGINVLDYRMKRHLLFDRLKSGGLEREPEDELQYRVAIGGLKATAPDWGFDGKKVLFQQCADCHMSPKLQRLGVASIPSITHSGGFDAGAMMGVSRPLDPEQSGVRAKRVARYKSRHESYRRLLEHLGL